MTVGWKAWFHRIALPVSLALTGCVGTPDTQVAPPPDETEPTELEQSPATTQATALATPDEFGDYFADGVGAFLSAKNDVAELTLYLLPPAKTATIKHPSLLLVMPEDLDRATETNDFEDVTLETGQSHAFHVQAPGTLTQVIASFEY